MAAFANLTEAQRERLEMLVEECSEVVHAATKILRHGYDSYHPEKPETLVNRKDLQYELLDLWTICERMIDYGDIGLVKFNTSHLVWKKKLRYTHHQPEFHHPLLPKEKTE